MSKLLRLVAWLEVLTGVFMIIDIGPAFLSSNGNVAVTLDKGLFIALGTLGLLAGIGLFRSSKLAWRGSLLVQLLQIPVFLIGTIQYRPGLGAFVPLGVNIPATGNVSALFEFTLGVDFIVSARALNDQPYVAVNLAALGCLMILLRAYPVGGKRI